MAMSPKLELRQSQSLVMTPQLQQAIKLLQLSNLELTNYVEQELERNPLLERDERADAPVDAERPEPEVATRNRDDGIRDDGTRGDPAAVEVDTVSAPNGADASGDSNPLDTDYSNNYDAGSTSDGGSLGAEMGLGNWQGRGGSFDSDEFGIEQTVSEDMTLGEHLTAQLQVAIPDPVRRMIGAYLIESLDDAGYVTEPLDQIAEKLGIAEDDVLGVLRVIQSFDPTGVGARDLKECVALQLKEMDRLDPFMELFLEHLELLAKHDLDGLAKACGSDMDDVRSMIADLRTCNPKPGLSFVSDVAQTVVPDVFVRENPDGGWTIELNSETLPRVLVNSRYYSKVAKEARSKDDRAYMTECMNNANWLVKSLDQRARTILKVSTEIVRQQDAFFVNGVAHLRPLNLRAIAEAISMHESTVSRVTANKYMATPRGIFELKYFFSSAIASAEIGGDAHSAESVRHKIRELIEAESAGDVMSDDKLVDVLKKSGIDIARRTVAKYREAMHIPSSVQRRRRMKMSIDA
ncbi:MAG: RNA polymerase factor sigma-54 [Alphaproteobacteria bacterium]